jgi:hypothetical protein
MIEKNIANCKMTCVWRLGMKASSATRRIKGLRERDAVDDRFVNVYG